MMDDEAPHIMPPRHMQRAARGRGALSNRSGRYEHERRAPVDDGWDTGWVGDGEDGGQAGDDAAPRLATTVTVDSSRGVLTRNRSPDVPFDRSVNPYRGCEHGCIYCFARPSHAWLGLSPGLDFETRLFHKPHAPEQLARALSARGYRPAPLVLGSNTDPYQPVERELGLTRRILEVLERFRHPVAVITKSALVLRDADILARMAAQGLAHVSVSLTTLDRGLARRLEPRAATPARRLEAMWSLDRAGVPVAVLASPMIPGLTDHELEAILSEAARAGASGAGTILLRLPLELAGLFEEWLQVHAPARAGRVLSLLRQCRGGGLNQAAFGRRMSGSGPYAALLSRRFHLACARLGLGDRLPPLNTALFRPPPADDGQLTLF
jgi:DNA repair photolyase